MNFLANRCVPIQTVIKSNRCNTTPPLHGEGHVSCSQILSICNSICHKSRFTERSHRNRKKNQYLLAWWTWASCVWSTRQCMEFKITMDKIALWNRMLPFDNLENVLTLPGFCCPISWFLFWGWGRCFSHPRSFKILNGQKCNSAPQTSGNYVPLDLRDQTIFFFLKG